MDLMEFLNSVPEILVSLSFFPSGIIFGYVLYLPYIANVEIDKYGKDFLIDADLFYPYAIMAASAIITSILINLLKMKQNYLIFYHFYILFLVWIGFLISGILFVQTTSRGNYYPLYIGAIANGIAILVSENYINLRSRKTTRASRIAFCYFIYFLGIFTAGFCYSKHVNRQSLILNICDYNIVIGIILIVLSSLLLIALIFNGTQQLSLGLYDYKECLDMDTNEASNTKSLFLEKQGKLHTVFTLYMILTKCFGFVTFNYVFFRMASLTDEDGTANKFTIIPSIFLLGSIIGALLLRKVTSKIVFTVSCAVALLSLILAWSMEMVGNYYGVGIVLFIFYFACSMAYSIPSQHILEITNLKYTEIAQVVAYTIELFLIASVQIQELHLDTVTNSKFIVQFIISAIILITSVLLVILHMPKTFRRSHVEIRDHISNFQTYFIFKNKFYDLNPL